MHYEPTHSEPLSRLRERGWGEGRLRPAMLKTQKSRQCRLFWGKHIAWSLDGLGQFRRQAHITAWGQLAQALLGIGWQVQ
ncbi:hypothetical protein D3C81_894770 [compost metagenome]